MNPKQTADAPSPCDDSVLVDRQDAPLLDGVTGREDNEGADRCSTTEDEVRQPVGATPRSAVTGRHDPGTGANETADGLSGSDETVRRTAEEVPSDRDVRKRNPPVFDRDDAPPSIWGSDEK